MPDPRDYRLTNEALLGTFFDDNSESIAGLQTSLGTYDGGPVVQKDFPAPGFVPDFPLLGPELSALLANTIIVPGASATRLMIPETPNGPLYHWRAYDRVGAPDAPAQVNTLGNPFTSPASEVTDIHQFARAIFEGATDAWEQYFPMRLLADDGAFLTGGRSGDLSGVRYEDGPARRPYLEILATEGVASAAASGPLEPGVEPRRRVLLPGHNHIDVTTAAFHQNGGAAEAASDALTSFVLQVAGPQSRATPPARPPAIRLSVSPGRVLALRRVRFRFVAGSSVPRCRVGATVSFAGRRVRTDGRGRASLTLRLARGRRDNGRRRAVALRHGCTSGVAVVRVLRARAGR